MSFISQSTQNEPADRLMSTASDDAAIISTPLPADYSRLIAEISARLVKASNEELDAEIMRSLKEALQPLGIDRGGLLEVAEHSPVVKLTFAWYAEGIEHVSGEVNLAELFPWVYRQVVHGKTWGMTKVDDLPPEADIDRQSYLLMGTKSALTIPLFIGQRVHHFFALNSQRAECVWSVEAITHLRLLGEIFVSALQRREVEQALQDSRERLDLSAASADAGLWEIDLTTNIIWLTNKARELFNFPNDEEITWEKFLQEVHPDDRQKLLAVLERALDNRDVSIEYRVLRADGGVNWMYSRGRLQETGPSRHKRLMGVTLDVTQRKRLEQQLHEQFREIERLKERFEQENLYLQSTTAAKSGRRELNDPCGSLRTVMAQVEQVAKTGSTVLIQGETGTGKELVAHAIHRLSSRGHRAMIVVNCASLPAALVESELFGREKGAFTGALTKQVGRFELADGSTLFLDEIGELPLETQVKLLRVLQEGKFEHLGSPRTIQVDVRIIAATNRNLADEVAQGRFRRDLYYRLNVFPLHVPPLRERREDIPQLVWEFVTEFGERMGKKIRRISTRDMEALMAYPWPGNVRELRNVIEHALIISNGDTLQLHRNDLFQHQGGGPLTLVEVERRHIVSVLKSTNGRIKGSGGAAELLGLNPSTLYFRIRKLGITTDRT